MKNINFGIIGCGDVTEKKSGPAFKKVDGSDLVMVMRRDENKLKDYAKRHNIEKYTTDYKELLSSDDVDAIYIATPPKYHHYYVLEAAKYKKPIYVEKPMALTVKECEEMVEICKENQTPLYVAYYRRGQEKFKAVKNRIDSGDLGEIRSFHYVCSREMPEYNPNRDWLLKSDESGGGLLYDVGSHMVDTLLFFFGDVKRVTGISANQTKIHSVNDVTSGFIAFENGVQGSIQLTFNGSIKEDKLIIIGSEGSIELSIMEGNSIIVNRKGVSSEIEFEELEHVQQPFIQLVVDSIHGKNNLDNSGIAGLNTQKVLEALNKAVIV